MATVREKPQIWAGAGVQGLEWTGCGDGGVHGASLLSLHKSLGRG